jgi:hypothetical protein
MKIENNSTINRLNDAHYKKIFKDCISTVGENNCDYAYVLNIDVQKIKTQRLDKKLVLIAVRDHFHHPYKILLDNDFDNESMLIELAVNNPDKLFVLFLEYFSLEHVANLTAIPNIKIILWYGNLTDDLNCYQNVEPVRNKNFEALFPAVCLNRYARSHRLVLLSYLYGQGLENNTHLSLLKLNDKITANTELLDLVDWEFANDTEHIQQIIKSGFKKIFANRNKLANNEKTYSTVPGTETVTYYSNAQNFQTYLRYTYSNSLIEFVSESLYETPYGSISEKFLNSVYGYNFPILIAVPGAVQFLRDLGFDMFDDVIDHKYDQIEDNLKRIHVAINSNRHLITNKENLIEHWKKAIPRFAKNLDFAKNTMPAVIHHNVITSFTKCVDDFFKLRVE